MSALVVSAYAPVPGTGRAARTEAILRALARLGPVELLHTDFGGAGAPPAGVRAHAVTTSRGGRRALAWARARAAGAPQPVARGVSPELSGAAARLAPRHERVIADDPMAAVALLGLARRRPVIYSAHNLESRFRRDWGPAARLRAFEARLLRAAAESWLPSRADLAAAAELAPGATLRYVPNAVDVAAIEPRRAPVDPPEALLVADLTYEPNREGLELLLRDVLPRAWESAPQLRLVVAGRGFEARPGLDSRVSVLGFVDDLAPLYARAACALVPLLTGGGSPLKFVEALAHGVPVVSTSRGAAGLDVDAGRDYLEGDGAGGLAAALLEALDAGRGAAIGAAGRAFAEREHSIEALARRLAA